MFEFWLQSLGAGVSASLPIDGFWFWCFALWFSDSVGFAIWQLSIGDRGMIEGRFEIYVSVWLAARVSSQPCEMKWETGSREGLRFYVSVWLVSLMKFLGTSSRAKTRIVRNTCFTFVSFL